MQSNEFNFDEIVKHLPDIIYRIDTEGRFVYLNNSVALLGYTPDELIGKHFSELLGSDEADRVTREVVLAGPKPDETDVPPKFFNERRTGKRITRNLRIGIPLKTGKREYVLCEVVATGFFRYREDGSQKHVGTVGLIRDISEVEKGELHLLQNQKYYQTLLEQLIEVIVIMTTDGTILYTTRSIYRMLGYHEHHLVGENVYNSIEKEDAGNLSDRIWLLRTQNIPTTSFTVRVRHANGQWRYVKFVMNLVKDDEGEPVYIVLHLLDVSDQRETLNDLREEIRLRRIAEKEKERARLEAVEANNAKGLFLSHVSHEVRNPLNVILGFSEMLEERLEDDSLNELLGYVQEAGKNLLSVINQILTYSKLESGSENLETIDFNPYDLVTMIDGMFRALAQKKGLEFEALIDKSVPRELHGDENKITQIIMNILGNSFKFTEQGKVSLTMAYESGSLQIICNDTGIGIPEDKMGLVFEPFIQADMSNTRSHSGTGLGLSIIKDYAHLMGGAISLTSRENQGTTVTVSLPLEHGLASENTPQEKKTRGVDRALLKELSKKGPMKILVAEDDELNQKLVERSLSPYGIEIHLASNGQEALEAFTMHDFHMAIVDIQMPVMDGISLLNAIRSSDRGSMPVYIMTGNVAEDYHEEARNLGADGIITKPLKLDELYHIVNYTVKKYC